MYTYDRIFSQYHHTVAQLLITGEDVKNETRHNNFNNTLERLLELNAIPVINENDTVATEEIVIGDNDTLAAIVASSVKADKLILLSDIDGLYTADPHTDPHAKLIPFVHCIDDKLSALAGGTASGQGTGGMVTKLNAASMVNEKGIGMLLTNGAHPERVYEFLAGEKVGTYFKAEAVK